MLSYLCIGANDVDLSAQFYEALLFPLGYEKEWEAGQPVFSLPGIPDRQNGPGAILICKPFDGKEAKAGNGIMPGFRVPSRKLVDEIYAAGLQAQGTDEGAPGIRERYSSNFYVAYLRDPAGNKVALFCNAE